MTKILSNECSDVEQLLEKSLLPTNDVIFHCLFGTEKNKRITGAFLEAILERKVEELILGNSLYLEPEYYNQKLCILDVKVKTKSGINYNIEMQNTSSKYLPKRILAYWSKMYTADLKKGGEYKNLNKSVAIMILNDKISRFKDLNKYQTKWNIREEDYKDIILTEDIEIRIVELKKYIEMKKHKKVKQNIWIDFLIEPKGREVLKAMKSNERIREAVDAWETATMDEQIRDLALRIQFAEMDRNSDLDCAREEGYDAGMKSGVKRGIEQEKLQNAKKMLEEHIPMEIVIKITGLTKEEIEKLQKENN